MKTLDRYILRSFLFSALLWFAVLMALRIIADLFVNMDEFTEQRPSFGNMLWHIFDYYRYQALVYFIELGGVIIVASAAFTLARMNQTNELTAMLASGVNLHRVVWPIILCAAGLGGLIILDQELIIPHPSIRPHLARSHDDPPGKREFSIDLIPDGARSIWNARLFKPAEEIMYGPVVLVRDEEYRPLSRILAKSASPRRLDGEPGWMFQDAALGRITREGVPWPRTPSCEKVWSRIGPERLLQEAWSRIGPKQLPERAKKAARQGGPAVPPAPEIATNVRTRIGPQQILDRAKQVAREGGIEPPPDPQIATVTDLPAVTDPTSNMVIRADSIVLDPFEPRKPRGGRIINPRFSFPSRENAPLRTLGADSATWRPGGAEGGYWELAEGRCAYRLERLPPVADALYNMVLRADEVVIDLSRSGKPLGGRIANPRFSFHGEGEIPLGTFWADSAVWHAGERDTGYWELANGGLFYPSDLTSDYLVLRQSSRWVNFMSTAELTRLLRVEQAGGKAALLVRHTRFTDPINNLIMLLLGLPFILSRERTIRASASGCLLVVGLFYLCVYACRYVDVPPQWTSLLPWLPILVFGPAAAVMWDSVKT